MQGYLLVLVGITLLLPVARGVDPAPETDAWKGKSRSAITALLGEPSKAKKSREGEILTYKFVGIGGNVEPGPDIMLVNVPGVGVVGKAVKTPTDGTFALEPSGVDGEGRLVSGGVVESQTRHITLDPDTRETHYTGTRTDGPTPGAKIKVKFELDANGRVANWSVSGAGRGAKRN